MRSSLIPLLLLSLAACVKAPATIDRVQPGAVDKTTLEGEWYWQNTVADVPYGSAATFTGAQTALERVRWEVSEEYLYGYRSYENVSDSGADGEPTAGAAVLAYRIEKHFDIRRSYDPTTGEESNVIEENTEQPWYEREYMRVDWSANLIEGGWEYAGVNLPFVNQDSTNPDDEFTPQFDDTDDDGVIDSINLLTRVLAQPDITTIPGYGDYPTCWFYGSSQYECDAAEISIASSFLKVDEGREYAGLNYDDRWMETFGVFEVMRLSYDRRYGLTEAGRVWYAQRHNVWGEWFQKDEDGQLLCEASGVTAACEDFASDDVPAPLELRYADRSVRPIVYHLSHDFPEELHAAALDLGVQWNEPFKELVNGRRYWECIDEGGDPGACESVVDDSLEVVIVCPNNPSLPDDPALCSTDHTGPDLVPDGEPDTVQIGDLRYNQITMVRNPQISSPYGYGPSAADPYGSTVTLSDGGELTLGAGEVISANAYLYEHVLDRVTAQTADIVSLLNGQISEEDFVDGENVAAWVEAVRSGDTDAARTLAGGTHGWDGWDEGGLAEIVERMDTTWSAPIYQQVGDIPSDPEAMRDWLERTDDALTQSGIFGGGASEVRANWDALLDSPFDEALWNEETMLSYGLEPGVAAPADASALDLIDPAMFADAEAGLILAGQHAVDLAPADYTDPGLVGLAQRYKDSGLSYDELLAEIRERSFVEVTLHELGHNMGLRHNFAGSFDAFNFHPSYWELRDDGEMGPRHVDPETSAELNGGIREFQYSSVMDYHAGRTTGWHGLGSWDGAAVKFIYGQLVEVMNGIESTQAVSGMGNSEAIGWVSLFNNYNTLPTIVLNYSSGEFLEFHYTDFPKMADLEARVDVPLERLEGEAWGDMMTVSDGVDGLIEAGAPAAPFRFCSDEFASGLTCDRWDEGADTYEIQASIMERYWNGYLLNNFKRGRYGFEGGGGYLNRVYGRTFDPIRTLQVYYALYHGTFGVEFNPYAAEYFAADKGFGGWTAGTAEAFQFLGQVLLRPEPGAFEATTDVEGHPMLAPTYSGGEVEVPLITGAYYSSEWDSDEGYHWFDKQSVVGTYWDKLLAMQILTTTEPYPFLGMDTAVDPRTYGIGFQNLWPDAIALFLARLQAGEAEAYAPVVDNDGALTYPDLTDLDASWPPAGTQEIEPGAYWSIQFSAGLMGKALLNRGYDHTFLNRSLIYLDGSGESLIAPKGTEEVRFTDPFSNRTYVAWSFPAELEGEPRINDDGQDIELGSAARMLDRANRLKDLCELETIASYTDPENWRDLDWQEDWACAELESYASDVKTQYEIFQYFDARTQ